MANSSIKSLISQFCLNPMLLGTLAILASVGHLADQAIAETPKPVNSSPITGTWKLTPNNPSFSVNLMPPLKIIITPEGKLFVQDPLRQDEYTEVGIIRKSSDNSSLPPNAKILPPHSSTNRARNSEAKAYVGSMNRGQQAHFLEKETWSKSLQELGIPMKSETENYRYSIQVNKAIATATTKPYTDAGIAINLGIARKPNLKSYVGIVWLQDISVSKDVTSYASLCESIEPTMKLPPIPKWDGREIKCPEGYKPIF
ncbi:type IV pilin-like G/H family protein [Pseudanabaena yagii]|uniref:Uncharacterized protein n=1 Tax=Pseudanabaena yagii GIHE-NHR1 TaxID=2722753 RepID=A0ABX1LM40_9CYAN|nr:type IV pilin-like G/H family protein [Pseudanabaena yagii]NMF56590.1 hypothetical protein [Pseudanabaena yagii GIHE-NHR1]